MTDLSNIANIDAYIFGASQYSIWLKKALQSAKEEWPDCAKFPLERQIILLQYTQSRPNKFFNRDLYKIAIKTLNASPSTALCNLPLEVSQPLEHALLVLRMRNNTYKEFYPGKQVKGDSFRPINERDDIPQELLAQEIREVVLSDYAMLAENVLKNLIRLLLFAFFRRVGITMPASFFAFDFIDLWNNAKKHLGIADVYDPHIRNAIAHGRVQFKNDQVIFIDIDKRKQEVIKEIPITKVIRLADNLLDACNGIAVALLESIVLGGALADLTEFERLGAISLMQTPFLKPTGIFTENTSNGEHVAIYGHHSHWTLSALWIDIARAFVIAKKIFPQATRYFVNFKDGRDVSYYYNVENQEIPTTSESVTALYAFSNKLPAHGLGWIEHKRLLIHYLSKIPQVSTALNWLHDLDLGLPVADSPNYEFRHFKDISVTWQSRFNATIISCPRAQDLNEEGEPTIAYLSYLSSQTVMRWLIREVGERNFGANRLKLFKTGFISVYPTDARLIDLQRGNSWLFQFEIPMFAPLPIVARHWKHIGRYYVLMNPAAREFLKWIMGNS